MIDCKLVITYSYVGYTSRKDIPKPSMFYKVKIKQGHYEHTINTRAIHT